MTIDVIITSAAVGALISALFAFLTQWFTQRREERRHLRELAYRVAVENWKHNTERCKNEGGGIVPPLDVFVVHAVQLLATMTDPNVSPDIIRQRLRHAMAVTDAAEKEIDAYNNRKSGVV